MKITALFAFVFLVMTGCSNNNATAGLLAEPPYRSLTDSIQQEPDNAGLYYRRGALLYQNNQKTTAEQDLKKAWQLQPTEAHALSVVTVLIDQNRDSALAFIQQALQVLPKSVALHISLARGYQQKGDVAQALSVTDQVLAQHPNSLDALLLKAELQKQQNNRSAALATLEKAYAYAPFDAELAYNLAFEYAETRNAKVLALTDSLIRMDASGRHAEPYYIKGVYYENTGNTAQALLLYDQAIQRDYNFLDAYMDKGRILYNQKKYDQALKTFQLPLTITPTYAEAYYWVARCQQALNQKEEARLNYQRAYGLDQTLTEAKESAEQL